MAQIIQLHPPRTCVRCEHFDTPHDDVGVSSHCNQWDETIDEESIAEQCPEYQPNDERHDRP